jgi:hypothetical protein
MQCRHTHVVQAVVAGGCTFVEKSDGLRFGWGEGSGDRDALRNWGGRLGGSLWWFCEVVELFGSESQELYFRFTYPDTSLVKLSAKFFLKTVCPFYGSTSETGQKEGPALRVTKGLHPQACETCNQSATGSNERRSTHRTSLP